MLSAVFSLSSPEPFELSGQGQASLFVPTCFLISDPIPDQITINEQICENTQNQAAKGSSLLRGTPDAPQL